MSNLHNKYSVNKSVTESILKNNGFKNGVFKSFIYKDLIMLFVTIDIKKLSWDYNVHDVNHDTLYFQYYSREYGKSNVVEELDKKISEILNEMVKGKILIDKERDNKN